MNETNNVRYHFPSYCTCLLILTLLVKASFLYSRVSLILIAMIMIDRHYCILQSFRLLNNEDTSSNQLPYVGNVVEIMIYILVQHQANIN